MAMPAALATSITVRIVPSVPALRWARALLAPRPLGGDPCQVRSTARIDSKCDRPSQIPLRDQGGADAYRAVWDSRADSRVSTRGSWRRIACGRGKSVEVRVGFRTVKERVGQSRAWWSLPENPRVGGSI